jgi:NitT/TauT family transport system substrate-binding protein
VRGDSGVKNPMQLSGRRVGVVRASSSHYFLEAYLLTNRVDPAGVQVLPLQPEELVPALREGRVDAIAAWEPFAYLALRDPKLAVSALPGHLAYRETFNLVVERRLLAANGSDVTKLLRALERAQTLIQEEPQRAQAVLRRALDVDGSFVDWIWPQLQYRLSLDQGLLKTLESEARWAVREGHVVGKRPPNFLPYLHAAPLLGVKPDFVGIAR